MLTYSPAAARDGRPPPMHLVALDAAGRWVWGEMAMVPPRGDPAGATPEQRGFVRYLGVWFSYEGCDDQGRWKEQRRRQRAVASAFHDQCTTLRPDILSYMELLQGVEHNREAYTMRVCPLPNADVTDRRRQAARGAMRVLGLVMGKSATAEQHLLMAPRSTGVGAGLPDIYARQLRAMRSPSSPPADRVQSQRERRGLHLCRRQPPSLTWARCSSTQQASPGQPACSCTMGSVPSTLRRKVLSSPTHLVSTQHPCTWPR